MNAQTFFRERQAVLLVGLLTGLSGCFNFGPAPEEPCLDFYEHCAPPAEEAAPESWSRTGSTNDYGDEGHTATLLPSGKVLVTGGSAYNSSRATAELYDPETRTWSLTSNLLRGRQSHTATLLPSGKVLVAGGYHPHGADGWGSPYLATAELYDPGTGTWSATGNLLQGRRGHTATLLPSGKVLVVGGSGGTSSGDVSKTAELYDPETGTWSTTSGPEVGRRLSTATLLPSGKVLVVGGSYAGVRAELYDPEAGTWSRTGSLAKPRRNHTATLLKSGKVLVASGYLDTTSELYDPEMGTWSTTKGQMSNGHEKATATLLPSGKVLVVGGGWPFGEVYTP